MWIWKKTKKKHDNDDNDDNNNNNKKQKWPWRRIFAMRSSRSLWRYSSIESHQPPWIRTIPSYTPSTTKTSEQWSVCFILLQRRRAFGVFVFLLPQQIFSEEEKRDDENLPRKRELSSIHRSNPTKATPPPNGTIKNEHLPPQVASRPSSNSCACSSSTILLKSTSATAAPSNPLSVLELVVSFGSRFAYMPSSSSPPSSPKKCENKEAFSFSTGLFKWTSRPFCGFIAPYRREMENGASVKQDECVHHRRS